MPTWWRRACIAIAVVAAASAPALLADYRLFQLTQAGIYAIALMGLNVLVGYSGQISLGHGAFFALGAYGAAILAGRYGFSPYLAAPASASICFAAGYGFGLPALKLHGLYLALATLALALALPQLLRFDPLEPWTGGVQGLIVDKLPVPPGLPLSEDAWSYYVVLALLVVLGLAAGNMISGRIGRALIALRDRPLAAEAMGIDTASMKTVTFAISAFYAGLAGALSAFVIGYVSPDSFDFFLSIALLVGVVVGGLGSIAGSVIGGLFLVFVPNVAQGISLAAPWAIYGLILIALMLVAPDGAAGLARRFSTILVQRIKRLS